ncbi:helix-turn-helix domain-containing protein [Novosphingobium sp. PY1]|uniref:ISSpo6, transposase orf A n=1 Tax=Ochrobactrum sp. PW1 TaxID=1882222 RepID=A0A292GMB9_9HYPH|nr:helix-turn-helix domain-containing protein [Novosphingobium sp. PY1]BBA74284.1 ISSpo6, transposase orf A [Ochrobactrum sp. PW1]GFM29133.1 ISSpo6, transposase orf A [Novosphingobium sp. PY1]
MAAPLPTELRNRFLQYLDEGLSGRAAAARLKVSPATGSRWLHSARTKGHVEPAPQGRPKGSGKLEPYHEFFVELVGQDPDITLYELRDALEEAEGVRVHHSSIAMLLQRLGYTYKKVAGGQRAPQGERKATAGRLVRQSPSGHARATLAPCLH